MPESCWACRFNVDAWCTATIQKNKYNDDVYDYARDKTKPDWCPLVEVPTPHGDLIDIVPFVQYIKEHWDSYDQWFIDQIEARPIVIEAEESE